jgi:hypothetical protein
MIPIGLVFSIHDPTEVAIQKMIEASQRMLKMNTEGELGGINPAMKKHLELEIKTLQNAPRDADKLERLLKVEERKKEKADPSLEFLLERTASIVFCIEFVFKVLYFFWVAASNCILDFSNNFRFSEFEVYIIASCI